MQHFSARVQVLHVLYFSFLFGFFKNLLLDIVSEANGEFLSSRAYRRHALLFVWLGFEYRKPHSFIIKKYVIFCH